MIRLVDDRVPSITTFRGRIRAELIRERERGHARDVVILAIDGIPADVACGAWRRAHIERQSSVFPTTTSTAWLSALTGLDVAGHGIPGVVFSGDDGALINVFDHRQALRGPRPGTIFTDAAEVGYEACAILGDLQPLDCWWRSLLLEGASILDGHHFFTADPVPPPHAIAAAIQYAIADALGDGRNRPRLIWCFVDADLYIHHHGYDELVHVLLGALDKIASSLAAAGRIVIAHSDHGLVPTTHRPEIGILFDDIQQRFDCRLGGAGRTRWIYSRDDDHSEIERHLRDGLPASIDVLHGDQIFGTTSLARSRVGNIVISARGSEFVTFSGHCFDHGSATRGELAVPYATWSD